MTLILLILVFLVLGIVLGAKGVMPRAFLKRLGTLTSLSVFALLFVLGVSIGINRHIIQNRFQIDHFPKTKMA